MGRVAIVTLTGLLNYGNRLQNYALQEVLRSQGVEAVTLWADGHPGWERRMVVRLIQSKIGHITLKRFHDYQKGWADEQRIKNFTSFNDGHLKSLMAEDKKGFFPQNLGLMFDFFIAGSDQVWNPLLWNVKRGKKKTSLPEFHNYLLRFAPPEKRVAYAASFGIAKIPAKWEKSMAADLAKFRAISVREEAGARIIKEMLGYDVPVTLDPTMLLEADQWRRIEAHRLERNERYILTYFLTQPSQSVTDEIAGIARATGMAVVEIMNPKSKYYALPPDAFLELIDHAQFIFTDSFHGSVFSVLFHKPFRVYKRHLPDGSDMGSRIDTLLAKIQLDSRIRAGEFPTQEDFERADRLLEKEREASLGFLKDALCCPR